jgi:hypothetical protein
MTKRMFGIVLMVLILAAAASAQPVPGKKFEFSTGAYFWNVKFKGATESTTILNVPIRFGVFLLKGLEFEPEVLLTIPDESDSTGVIFLGNFSYNFKVGETVVPFILAGGGYGNAEEVFSMASKQAEGVGIAVIDAGLGVKLLFGHTAALRVEYRFVNYSGSKTVSYNYGWGSYTHTYDFGRTDHKVFTGISLFF